MIVLRVGKRVGFTGAGIQMFVKTALALGKKASSGVTGLEKLFQANQPWNSLTRINHS